MKTIWIVDDDKAILDALSIALAQQGYEVKIVISGKQFYSYLKKSLPDLILLDVYIEDMNGREIVRYLKTTDETKKIPVILSTADVFAIKNAKKDKYKADGYLSKPFSLSEMLSLISKFI